MRSVRLFIFRFCFCFSLCFRTVSVFGSSLFAPDSDTALLFQLVTTTASQLNEMEKLVTNAGKYTAKMQEYNELANDHYFRAERTLYLVEDMKGLADIDKKNLGVLNSKIRGAKDQLTSFKSILAEYKKREAKNDQLEIASATNEKIINQETKLADFQLKRADGIKTLKGANKLTAQNSALTYKSLVDVKKQNNLIISKLAEQNKILIAKEKLALKDKIQKEVFYSQGQHERKHP